MRFIYQLGLSTYQLHMIDLAANYSNFISKRNIDTETKKEDFYAIFPFVAPQT